jgi:predicted TIM-barrel fold metal-dependent hydrolase
MKIDFHTHLFPTEIRSQKNLFFEGEPVFELLYGSPKAKMAGADDIIRAMDEAGIDMSVVCGFPWKNPGTVQSNNDYILEAIARYPQRLVGFCCVNLENETTVREVERCLDAGMAGVGELAFYDGEIDDDAIDRLAPVMDLCRERDRPLMIHTNEPVGHQYPGKTPNTLAQLYRLPKTFPDNKIVLAHWGGGLFFYTLLKREVAAVLKNVYVDTAASPFLYDPAVYRLAAEILGPEKILFGSDYPLLTAGRYFDEMEQAGLSRADRDAICGLNAARLLGM